jgi:hypothetical protein
MISQYTLVFVTTSHHSKGSTVNRNQKNCSSVSWTTVRIPTHVIQARYVTRRKETGDDFGQTWLYAGARLWGHEC